MANLSYRYVCAIVLIGFHRSLISDHSLSFTEPPYRRQILGVSSDHVNAVYALLFTPFFCSHRLFFFHLHFFLQCVQLPRRRVPEDPRQEGARRVQTGEPDYSWYVLAWLGLLLDHRMLIRSTRSLTHGFNLCPEIQLSKCGTHIDFCNTPC